MVMLGWKWRISQGATGWRHGLQSFRVSFGRGVFGLSPPYILGCVTSWVFASVISIIGVIRSGGPQVRATQTVLIGVGRVVFVGHFSADSMMENRTLSGWMT